MERKIEYGWRLRELMAARGMNTISDILPHLEDRGVHLSASQIYRLIGSKPERMNIVMLGAILDTLDCTFEELCPVSVVATSSQIRTGTGGPSATDSDTIRPQRARILPPS